MLDMLEVFQKKGALDPPSTKPLFGATIFMPFVRSELWKAVRDSPELCKGSALIDFVSEQGLFQSTRCGAFEFGVRWSVSCSCCL